MSGYPLKKKISILFKALFGFFCCLEMNSNKFKRYLASNHSPTDKTGNETLPESLATTLSLQDYALSLSSYIKSRIWETSPYSELGMSSVFSILGSRDLLIFLKAKKRGFIFPPPPYFVKLPSSVVFFPPFFNLN